MRAWVGVAGLLVASFSAPRAQLDRTFLGTPLCRAPIALSPDGLLVDVFVDSDGPHLFLLDNGLVGDGAIDRSLARRLGILRGKAPVSARVGTLGIGEASIAGLDLEVRDLSKHDYSGVVGLEVFRDVLVSLDLSKRRMEIYRGRMTSDETVLYTLDPDFGCVIEAKLGDHRSLGELDLTRASGLVVPSRLWAAPDVPFQIGGVQIDQVSRVVDDERSRLAVGFEVLRHVAVTFDSRRRGLAMRPYRVSGAAAELVFDRGRGADLEVRRSESGHLLVRPLIGGADLGWFVFDTGASTTAISNTVAKRAGLERAGVGETVTLTRRHQSTLWRADSLQLGPLTVRGPRLTGLDEIDTMSRHVGGAVGVIGGDVWQHCLVEVDVMRGLLSLHDPNRFELPGIDWAELKFAKNVPLVPASFGAHRGEFLLDTGDPGTVTMFTATVKRLDLLRGQDTEIEEHAEVGGAFELHAGWLPSFGLFGRELRSPPATFATTTKGMLGSNIAAGSVGGGMFESFTVLLDYPRKQIAGLERDELELGDDELSQLVGDYRSSRGDACSVRRAGRGLAVEVKSEREIELVAESETGFRLRYGLGHCRFDRDRSGATTHMVLVRPGRSELRMRKAK